MRVSTRIRDLFAGQETVTETVYGVDTNRDAAAYAATAAVPAGVDLTEADGLWYDLPVSATYADAFTAAAQVVDDPDGFSLTLAEVSYPSAGYTLADRRSSRPYHPVDELSGLPHPVDDPRFGPR